MFIHSVYFWLRPDLTSEELACYQAGVKSLLTVPCVRHGWVATPALPDRPVIDRTYSYALILVFDDLAGHDAYQVDPIHDKFRVGCKGLWNQIKIYDAQD